MTQEFGEFDCVTQALIAFRLAQCQGRYRRMRSRPRSSVRVHEIGKASAQSARPTFESSLDEG